MPSSAAGTYSPAGTLRPPEFAKRKSPPGCSCRFSNPPGRRDRPCAGGVSSLFFRQGAGAGIDGVFAEKLFDAEKLVVFCQPVAAAQRAGLDLPAIRGQ